MAADDDAKELLEKMLAELYAKAAQQEIGQTRSDESYLIAADDQFLGKITHNSFDTQSITNVYGPFGSPYSQTSIFNAYSPYGSEYGQYSINNPYCALPPRLFLRGRYMGVVSANEYVRDRIPTNGFLLALKTNIGSLLGGELPRDEIEIRKASGDVFIEAADGTFLGRLNPNNFDTESIFNKFGPHGNKFSQSCIFNAYCPYGGRFSPLSPFNSLSQHPPKIYRGSRFVAFLTSNQRLSPRIDPNEIFDWARKNVRRRIV